MEEFKTLVLGPVSAWYYLAAEFFAGLAVMLSLLSESKERDVNSPSTPRHFSWVFLLWDNIKRIIAGQIFLFLVFRFSIEVIGKELNMWTAVGIGFFVSFGADKLLQYFKNRFSFLQMDRQKMIDKMSNTGENKS